MCFSILWFFQLIAFLIILAGIWAIIQLLLPYLGIVNGTIVQVLKIILGVIVALFVLWLIYDLIVCAMSMGGFGSFGRRG
jgi:hypothetical protein